jgi:hypothetical protein
VSKTLEGIQYAIEVAIAVYLEEHPKPNVGVNDRDTIPKMRR